MFAQRTVFVLGAGASNEFNLPLGGELKSKASNSINFQTENNTLQGDPQIIDWTCPGFVDR
jgi:hypothetical protein